MSSMRMLSIAAVSKTSPAHSMTYRAKWASDCFTFECQLFCGVFGCGKCDLQLWTQHYQSRVAHVHRENLDLSEHGLRFGTICSGEFFELADIRGREGHLEVLSVFKKVGKPKPGPSL